LIIYLNIAATIDAMFFYYLKGGLSMAIKKRGDNYSVIVTYRDAQNKKKQKWINAGPSLRDAQRKERELITDYSRGEVVFSEKTTVESFLNKWLDVEIKPDKREGTSSSYSFKIKNIIKIIGSVELEKLSPLKIKEYLNTERERGLRPTSVQCQYSVLKQALDKAVDWQLISKNPCASVDSPKRNAPHNAVYTPEEVQRFLDLAKPTSLYIVALLGFLCGLRRGEICGLRWEDINLAERSAFIRNSLSLNRETKQLELGPLKTDSSEGYIPIPHVVILALENELKQQKLNKLQLGPCFKKIEYVCCHEDGSPLYPNSLYHDFIKFIKNQNIKIDNDEKIKEEDKEKMKLPVIRIHDMRHTHATLLLRQKIDVKIVSKKLRHKKSSFTANYYQHVANDMQNETATAMDDMFGKKKISKEISKPISKIKKLRKLNLAKP
jgi:integrase